MKNLRNHNIDFIKTIASFCVVFVHFFLNMGFYNLDYVNNIGLLSFVLKNIVVTCIPLFMIVTGYLMNKKTATKKILC
ncbi:acyltransferase family protein [Thomasclavelia cocleata]|jgi:surface polysaccharide O-acyltransferase-like enzyme|uniref:acyltransferase family protein n=1 Tax=Thomasclavelia cocleata TaxID=69824 RepID=UPI00241C6FE0|nr:acyltransferase family protein [Thomasclavelia cocleata]